MKNGAGWLWESGQGLSQARRLLDTHVVDGRIDARALNEAEAVVFCLAVSAQVQSDMRFGLGGQVQETIKIG